MNGPPGVEQPAFGTRAASRITEFLGHPSTLLAAFVLVVLWLPSYFLVRDVNTWQLLVNTVTTIITFLVAFAIQSTQNRAERAMNAKLDAIIACTPGASNRLLGLEQADERDIKATQADIHAQVADE